MIEAQFTDENRIALEAYLATHELPKGLGSRESACSIAAINLAITGELTDNIPDCMSLTLGRVIICLQDAMPSEMRNSVRYKSLLPLAAGTGRKFEKQRSAVVLDWMWTAVLPQLQDAADKSGFGEPWRLMCKEKTKAAAVAANVAAARVFADADAARVFADAAAVADAAAAGWVAQAADADIDYAAAHAAHSTVAAVALAALAYVDDTVAVAARKAFWTKVDPVGLIERMINLT